MPIAPWEIDSGKVSGTGTPRPSSPSSRVSYRPPSQRTAAPLSSYGSWSERWIQPGLLDEDGSRAAMMDPAGAVTRWRDEYIRGGSSPTSPAPYVTSTSGGRRGGGGGGGGGMGLTAAQQAAMGRFLGSPALMSFTPFQAAKYTPYQMAPRDAARFQMARDRVGSARDADVAFARGMGDEIMQLLASQQNVMAGRQASQTPQMNQQYQRIVGGAGSPGAGMVGDVIDAENAYSFNSDGAFQNLLNVLAMQEDRNMQSRTREAASDQQAILNAIRGQASGMLGGIEFADLADAADYGRRKDELGFAEHRYGADRAHDVALQNWLAKQGVQQYNVGTRNDWSQLALDLIPMLTDAGILGGLSPSYGGGGGGAATVGTQAARQV